MIKKLPWLYKLFKSGEVLFLILSLATVTVLLISLIPLKGNYKFLLVQSGSMYPAIKAGSVVLSQPQDEYQIGDIISFRPKVAAQNEFVTHRIIGFSPQIFGLVYQTKGDANQNIDPADIAIEQIFGKVIITIPYIGFLLNRLKSPIGLVTVVIVPATIIIYEEIKKIFKIFRHKTKEYLIQKEPKQIILANNERLLDKDLSASQNLKIGIPLVILIIGLSYVGITHSYLSDTEIGKVVMAVADTFEEPVVSSHIVINEIYYHVDPDHGWDSPKDRGVIESETFCNTAQSNQTEVSVNVDTLTNTGRNSASDNTGENTSIESGDEDNSATVDIQEGDYILENYCSPGQRKNHEWIELYNPTDNAVNLKNWTITDNSSIVVKIKGNKFIEPGKYALISRSNSTWKFWDEPSSTKKIALGKQIGDGLDNDGDRILLINPNGEEIDALSYGNDTSQFILLGVTLGHSLERDSDGQDTDTTVDWVDRFPPQPGI